MGNQSQYGSGSGGGEQSSGPQYAQGAGQSGGGAGSTQQQAGSSGSVIGSQYSGEYADMARRYSGGGGGGSSASLEREAAAGGGGKGQQRQREENMAFVYRWYDAMNRGDYAALQQMMDEKHVDHTWFGGEPVRPQAITRIFSNIFKAFPDWRETIDEIIASDADTIVVRSTGRGTQKGEFRGMPPTGEQIAVPLIHTMRIVNGKLKEYRSTNPFENPFTERVTAPEDVQKVRALQGGGSYADQDRQRLIDAYQAGLLTREELARRTEAYDAAPVRCQALLDSNNRRCLNQAMSGSIYCDVHQDVEDIHKV